MTPPPVGRAERRGIVLAAAVWTAVLVGCQGGARWAGGAALAGGAKPWLWLAAALLLGGLADADRLRRPAAVGLVLVAALSGALRGAAVEHSPLAVLTQDRSAGGVRLDAVAAEDARPAESGGWVVIARLVQVDAGDTATATRERVRLRGVGDAAPMLGTTLSGRGMATRIEGPGAAYFAARGIVVGVRMVDVRLDGAPGPVERSTTTVRQRLRRGTAAHLRGEEGPLLTGLVTGDVTGQSRLVAESFRRAGLSHLVAVSGSNVAIVVGGVLALLLLAGVGRRAALAVALPAIWWFALLVRLEPSVMRASAMATLVVGALLIGRVVNPVHLLARAATVALLVDPLLGRQVGFVLSVAATAGVILLAPRLHDRLPGPAWVRMAAATTIAAQVAVAPVLLAVGGSVGIAAVPANVVAVPAAGLAGAVGSAAAVVATWSIPLAERLLVLARPALQVILWSSRTFAGRTGEWLDSVGPWAVAGTLLAWGVRWAGVRGRGPRIGAGVGGRLSVGVAATAMLVAVIAGVPTTRDGADAPVLIVLDVGQGDAVLVGDQAGWVLVDGGPDPVALRAALRRHGVGDLAAVVLTHPHADHEAGLAGVLGDRSVGSLLVGPDLPAPPGAGDRDPPSAAELALAAGVPVHRVVEGDAWHLGAIAFTVLSPPPRGIDLDPNESSVVLRLDVAGGRSVLLTGDAEVVAQTRMLRAPDTVDVDVLKVPHHGGDTNAGGFLAATTPEVAVISAGEGNRFGHPHAHVLADLAGVEVRRTDEVGDVVVRLGP